MAKALIRKMAKMIGAYYVAYKTSVELGDSEMESILSDRIEGLLIDLVRFFETEEMYEYEEHLKFFGIHKGDGKEDIVQDVLNDVAKTMKRGGN